MSDWIHVRTAMLSLVLSLACPTGVLAGTTHDPNRTATIVVGGFNPDGSSDTGVYGDHKFEPLLDDLAGLVGLPTTNQPGGELLPNVMAVTTYYGDTPPPYYTAQDIADIDAVTDQWGGGIPRYAVIVAKYARHVMERSGAQQVNFASGSMGSLVARWLIEKNVEGLAGDGLIARWLSLEGVVSGNWAASRNEILELLQLFQAIDVEHMRYDWIEQHLHSPRTEADNPLYSNILIAQTASTEDSANDGVLTLAMLLYGEYQPNDSLQGVFDSYFQTITPPSLFLGRAPMLSFYHVNHFELEEYPGAWAQAVTTLTQKRRVTVTLTRAQVTNIHEPDDFWWDWTPAEILFETRVYSPEAARRWAITEPLSTRRRDGVSTPIRYYNENGEQQFFSHVIFDDLVLESETALEIELWGEEIDWDVRYGVTEPLGQNYDSLGGTCLTVPVTGPGTYSFTAPDFNGDISVEVFEYPFPSLTRPGDLNGDGVVNVLDLIDLLDCFGLPAVPGCESEDINADGTVNVLDLIELLLAFGSTFP